jgi:ElaB/YqjD/DUF883 family membrane-anchored ribosome-binding protein
MVELTRPTVAEATKKMKEGAKDLKQAVKTQTTETWNQYCDDTRSMIKSAPYKSVLIAFGVGALASALLFRRR